MSVCISSRCTLARRLPVAAVIAASACTVQDHAGPAWSPPAGAADDGAGTDDGGAGSADDGAGESHGEGSGGGPSGDSGGTEPDGGGADGNVPGAAVPEFGTTFTVFGTSADGLSMVRDLAFSPDDPTTLWTANRTTNGSVLFFDAGTPNQTTEVRIDLYAKHFMAQPSSFAFADTGYWACCNESRNDWNGGPQAPDDFMGPTLWSSDLNVYAVVNQGTGGEGSHMDMLHQSPLCMGIAHDSGNKYWAFDGLHGHIVYYDFASDHGAGGSDHSDGTVRRFADATVTRVPDVPSHMELDSTRRLLYVADTGGGRIMTLDTAGGSYDGSLPGNWDGLSEYSQWTGAAWTVFADGLAQPSGLALHDGRVLVSDFQTQEIIALDATGTELGRMQTEAAGIMGITVDPHGRLWYADGLRDEVVRVDP